MDTDHAFIGRLWLFAGLFILASFVIWEVLS